MIQHRDCRRASCDLQQPTSTKQRQRKSYPRQGSCEVLPSPAQPPAFGCRPCAHLSQHFSCGQRDPNSLLPPAVPSQQGKALCRAPGTPKPGLETQRHKTRSFPSYSSWSHRSRTASDGVVKFESCVKIGTKVARPERGNFFAIPQAKEAEKMPYTHV